ncbi:MAG: hypothetical protein KGJ78_18245 [Alphaproteobacteria bacterium]|nr:hypothetical protein [Alphaproteobacteria bacterium]
MKRITIAVFAVLQTAAMAHAAMVCANAGQLKFLQAAALRQQLALSVPACGYSNDYLHFMAVYRDAMGRSEAAARQFFQSHKEGETYEAFLLRLKQDALRDSTQDPHFCRSAKAVFDFAFKRAMDLAHPPPVIATGYESCRSAAPPAASKPRMPAPKIAAIPPAKPAQTAALAPPAAGAKSAGLPAQSPPRLPHILTQAAVAELKMHHPAVRPSLPRLAELEHAAAKPAAGARRHAGDVAAPRAKMGEEVRMARLSPLHRAQSESSGRAAARIPLPAPRPEPDATPPAAPAAIAEHRDSRRLAMMSPRKPSAKMAMPGHARLAGAGPASVIRDKQRAIAPAPRRAETTKPPEADVAEFDGLLAALAERPAPKPQKAAPILVESTRPANGQSVAEPPAAGDGSGERSEEQADTADDGATDDAGRLDPGRGDYRYDDERDRHGPDPRWEPPRGRPAPPDWRGYADRRPPPWAHYERRPRWIYEAPPDESWYAPPSQDAPDD